MGKRSQRQYRKGAHHAAEAVLAGLRAGAEGVDLVLWAEVVRKWRETGDGRASGAGRPPSPHPPIPPVLPAPARTGVALATDLAESTSQKGCPEPLRNVTHYAPCHDEP